MRAGRSEMMRLVAMDPVGLGILRYLALVSVLTLVGQAVQPEHSAIHAASLQLHPYA